jgi:hypothetical protein
VLFIFPLVILAYDVAFGVFVKEIFTLSFLAGFVIGWLSVYGCFWGLFNFLL